MSGAQRAVAASLLFLFAAGVAGIAPGEAVRYSVFGAVEGMFAMMLAAALASRAVWPRPVGWAGWLPLVYAAVATAQLLEFLLPPPGVVEWVVVIGLLFSSWGIVGAGSRRRVVHSLAVLGVLLALIRYSLIPWLWTVGPERGAALGLGSLAEAVRATLAEPRPTGVGTQLLGVLAAALWALATWLVWPPDEVAAEGKTPG